MKNIMELNELIYVGAKLVSEKSVSSPQKKKTLWESQTWYGNSTGNAEMSFPTKSRNNTTKENAEKC